MALEKREFKGRRVVDEDGNEKFYAPENVKVRRSRRTKGGPIPDLIATKIGRDKERDPSLSYIALARKHNVTYDQARYAHKRFVAGKLQRVRVQKSEKKILAEKYESTFDELFDQEMKFTLDLLSARGENVDPVQRSQVLERLQKMSITKHLRSADAGFLAFLVRKFVPDASDQQVIKLIREAQVEFKQAAE